MSILIRDVSKRFGNFVALDHINLEVPDGSLLALLGPSGSGKTTLLRIIAGLEVADSGTVHHREEDITHHSARDRKVGFVFQHYALFRHMTVGQNVGFGLRVRGVQKAEIQKRVMELLKLIRLESLESRYPWQLSGGQRQRVALARALAARPRVLLLDEPFGALDAKVRQELRRWLRRLHDEIHVTSIFVTHDQEEAMEVADHVVVMNGGRIEQMGKPEEVYHKPATPFVYDFLGNVNLLHGRVEAGKFHVGNMVIDFPQGAKREFESATIYIRPHLLDIDHQPNGSNYFRARVAHINPAGSVVKVELVSEWGDTVQVELTQDRYRLLDLKKDNEVFVSPRRQNITLWGDKPEEGKENSQ
jgi:sulfate transport system ATP-binding protein